MIEKINIAELLKDCPRGMELDCTMYDNCTFDGIEDVGYIDILVKTPSGRIRLTKEGCYIRHDDYAKCIIFPKGKTTWEGFHRPFEDGDIVYFITEHNNEYITIFKESARDYLETYIDVVIVTSKCSLDSLFYVDNIKEQRLATEEEKQKLFDAIKANGYRWDAETKTLQKVIKPILNKFDIASLKPFDKVLVRDNDDCIWRADFYSHYEDGQHYYYICVGDAYKQCIPYNKETAYLVGTTNDCPDKYKIWKDE